MSYIPKDCQSKTSLTHPMHSFGLLQRVKRSCTVLSRILYIIYTSTLWVIIHRWTSCRTRQRNIWDPHGVGSKLIV